MSFQPWEDNESALDKAARLQNGLVARATGGTMEDYDYAQLRRYFQDRADLKPHLPDFLRRCSDTSQFWAFIKHEKPSYQERRQLIWDGFRPLIGYLEAHDRAPGIQTISDALVKFDPEYVQAAWQKALDRRALDPDGAITAARSLLESVCKHILDDMRITYPHDVDLPQLWTAVSAHLNLAPHQQQEHIFKVMLGNCRSIVQHLAAVRNKVGDAHGQGRNTMKPKPHHAELVVNLAGAMASFLVTTWQEHKAAFPPTLGGLPHSIISSSIPLPRR